MSQKKIRTRNVLAFDRLQDQVGALEKKVKDLDEIVFNDYKKQRKQYNRKNKDSTYEKQGQKEHEQVKGYFDSVKNGWNYGWNYVSGNGKKEETGEGDEFDEDKDE